MSLSPSISVTRYINVEVPVNPTSGVNVIVLSILSTAVPSNALGASSILTSIPPSSKPKSLNKTSIVTSVFKLVPLESPIAIGISSSQVTVTVTEASSQSFSPSHTV